MAGRSGFQSFSAAFIDTMVITKNPLNTHYLGGEIKDTTLIEFDA